MSSEGQTDVQFVEESTSGYIVISIVVGIIFTFFGGVFLWGLLGQPQNILLFMPFIIPILTMIMTLLRNEIVLFVFRKVPHDTFLSLMKLGRVLTCFVAIVIVLSFIASFSNAQFVLFFLTILFLYAPLYLIFSTPLTHEGEIKILFEMLFSSLGDFENRQQWLKKISEKIENALKIGNIRVSHNDLVYYFNMRLLEEKDIQDSLRNIEAWLLGKQKLCFDSIKEIIPENKFEPCTENVLLKQMLKSPNTVKYVATFAFLAIVVIARPELLTDILNLLSKLV